MKYNAKRKMNKIKTLFNYRISISHALMLMLVSLIYSSSSIAFESDRDKPVYISADKVTINEKTGISSYTGNVSIKQGSMLLTGDKIMVYQPNGKLDKIIVNGKPALFKQVSDKNNQETTATAKKLIYHTIDEKLTLTGNANLKQGQNSFSGHIIEYDTRNSTVTANTDGDKKQRVNAVIIPKSVEKK